MLACLTGLKYLSVVGDDPKLTDDSLLLLSPLTNLTCLRVVMEGVSDVARREFHQGMPHLYNPYL